MDVNGIWVFDVSVMNNKRFNSKRGVARFMKTHITIV